MSKTKTARDGSLVVATVQRSLSQLQLSIDQPNRIVRLAETSVIRRVSSQIGRHLTNAAARSFVSVIVAFVQHAIRQSFLYRWLTAEPDSDVIVIDLRETWTVGPMISVLDRLMAVFFTAMRDSFVVQWLHSGAVVFRDRPIRVISIMSVAVIAAVVLLSAIVGNLTPQTLVVVVVILLFAVIGFRSNHSLAEIRETRILKLLVAAFEPPEPPESRTDTTPQAVETKPNGDTDSATRE